MGDNWGGGSMFLGGGAEPKKPAAAPMSAEQILALQQQIDLQNQQLEQERKKQEQAKTAMPELTYNPIEETVGPDGKKTIGLRKEFQLEGPEGYIKSERERLAGEQAGAVDTLQQQIAQQQAQQRAQMASRGGMRGGNQALLSRFSMRDALMGQQQLGRQAATQRGELEAKGYELGQNIKEKNLGNLLKSVGGVEQFNLDRWKKMKDVEASKTEAEATRAAGGSGGKK